MGPGRQTDREEEEAGTRASTQLSCWATAAAGNGLRELGPTVRRKGAMSSGQKRRGKDFPFSNPFLFPISKPISIRNQIKFKYYFQYTFQLNKSEKFW